MTKAAVFFTTCGLVLWTLAGVSLGDDTSLAAADAFTGSVGVLFGVLCWRERSRG